MKTYSASLLASIIILLTVFTVEAGSRAVIEVEEVEGEHVEKSIETITYDEKRFRIDFLGEDKKKTEQTPFIMTVNGGNDWVIGDKPKNKFYCSKMQTEQFFKNMGTQVTDAIEFFNVTAEEPTVKKILEEPGPNIQGYKTTHLQLETNAKAYTRILFLKFEYSVKIIDDLWYTTDVEIHPVRKKWINTLSQSGNSIIDTLSTNITSKIQGPILKSESVVSITNVKKNETKTQKIRMVVTEIEELKSSELDEIFKMPECVTMDDDEVQEKAKALLSADRIML